MPEPTRTVFDIMRFSIRDGPGIRTTVFFKGCPLDCWWCHNPEGLSSARERILRESRCIRCGACEESCPTGAVSGDGICEMCGTCVAVCPTGAREIVGREMTAAEIVEEVRKDRAFFEQSGGGVTFSGGEPLIDPAFLERLLDRCRDEGIHTAVDTCGHAPPEAFRRIRGKVDLYLYDLKLMDEERHRSFTGASNALILANLRELAGSRATIAVRLPLLPGINDDSENIRRTGELVADLGLGELHLLPYHATAKDKYLNLRKDYRLEDLRPPSEARLSEIAGWLEALGLRVRVGGR